MKFKIRNWYWRGQAPEMTIGELVAHEADQSDSDGGALEDIQRSLKAISTMLGILLENLPQDVQVRIAKELGADPVEGKNR